MCASPVQKDMVEVLTQLVALAIIVSQNQRTVNCTGLVLEKHSRLNL